jgi:hypothetical protein
MLQLACHIVTQLGQQGRLGALMGLAGEQVPRAAEPGRARLRIGDLRRLAGGIDREFQSHTKSRDPLKLARYYQSLLDTDKFESRALLPRYLGVSQERMPQLLLRLGSHPVVGNPE